MSLVFIDGFDHYYNSDDATYNGLVAQKWDTVTSFDNFYGVYARSTTGRLGGRALTGSSTYSGYSTTRVTKVVTAATTYIAGCAFQWIDISTGSGNRALIQFKGGGSFQCTLGYNDANQFVVWRGDRSGTQLAITPTAGYIANRWYYIEFKVTIGSGSAGSYEARVDGVSILSSATANTQGAASATIDEVAFNARVQAKLDDCYICNTSGAVNNDFLGECRVVTQYPNTDGSQTDWTITSPGIYYYQFAPQTMSNNSSPAPYVISASSEYYGAFTAFNSNPNQNWLTYNTVSGWLQLDLGLGNQMVLAIYALAMNGAPEPINRAPKDWTMLGSNDGTSFDVLDTVTNQTGWTDWERREYVCDSISVTRPYRYFRINITANNGSTYTQIQQVQMYRLVVPTSHYQQVFDPTPDNDISYVSTGTIGNTELLQFDVTPAYSTIYGVQKTSFMKKDDVGLRQAQHVAKVGGTTYTNSKVHSLGTNYYQFYPSVFEVNPATGVAWTRSEIDASEFGTKLVT